MKEFVIVFVQSNGVTVFFFQVFSVKKINEASLFFFFKYIDLQMELVLSHIVLPSFSM